MTKEKFYDKIIRRLKIGSLVKRLRHGPLKAETGVRFSHESPQKETGTPCECLFLFARPMVERTPHLALCARCGVLPLGARFVLTVPLFIYDGLHLLAWQDSASGMRIRYAARGKTSPASAPIRVLFVL